ncbi:MAG: formate/nitrite transporter family protein [Bdellovibrionota bacterium]|nr:formate/nitrite transporter family protein [Bdellovibrionota bacterium]
MKRSEERKLEDRHYTPVVIKRNDETLRHPDDILDAAIFEGMEQFERTKFSLFLSAIAAGLILGFVGLSVGFAQGLVPEGSSPYFERLIKALFYPLGFVVCILSRTQLFTEHTARAVYPFLEGKVKLPNILSIWAIVLIGNIVGTLLCSLLIHVANPVIALQAQYQEVFHHLIQNTSLEVFASAILAGWLMAQCGWLILGTTSTGSQMISIYIGTFLIGIGGLHHCIAGSAEVWLGLLSNGFHDIGPAFVFLVSAIIGNLIGGSLFVACLNYGHIRQA